MSKIKQLRDAGKITPTDDLVLAKLFVDVWDRANLKARDILEPAMRDAHRHLTGPEPQEG